MTTSTENLFHSFDTEYVRKSGQSETNAENIQINCILYRCFWARENRLHQFFAFIIFNGNEFVWCQTLIIARDWNTQTLNERCRHIEIQIPMKMLEYFLLICILQTHMFRAVMSTIQVRMDFIENSVQNMFLISHI